MFSEKLSSLDFSSKDLKLMFFKGISALFPALKIGLREGLYMAEEKVPAELKWTILACVIIAVKNTHQETNSTIVGTIQVNRTKKLLFQLIYSFNNRFRDSFNYYFTIIL